MFNDDLSQFVEKTLTRSGGWLLLKPNKNRNGQKLSRVSTKENASIR